MRGARAHQHLVPFGVGVAAGLADDHAREQRDEPPGRLGRRQAVHHLRGAIVIGAIDRRRLQPEIAERARRLEDRLLLGAHRLDHAVDAVELDIEHGAHQFGRAGAVAGERA